MHHSHKHLQINPKNTYTHKKPSPSHIQHENCSRFLFQNCVQILQMPYLQLAEGITVQQKDVKGAIAHTNKGVVRRMFVVNEPFSQASTQRLVSMLLF